jgi:hypothetical protein
MKTILSIPRVALLALTLGTASATASFAQSTNSTPTPAAPTCPAGGKHQHASILTADEKAQLKAAHDAALAANPSLQTQADSLKQQFKTLRGEGKGNVTKDQWQALHAQASAFHTQLRTAELAINPSLSSVFAKLDAAPRHHWNHAE